MTIYDIAKEAGVSASSVSRVVNNKPGVNAQTRRRVLELLQKHNYSPNALARGLVSQASQLIGVVVGDIRTIHHTGSAYYIERELEKQGYCCIILNTDHEAHARTKAIEQLARRRVEGAILIGSSFQTQEVETALAAHLSDVPVVMVNGYLNLPNVYGVLSDDRNGVEKCVEYLLSQGRKRLVFVRDARTPSSYWKEQGFLDAMVLHAAEDACGWTYEAGRTLQHGYDATRLILQAHPEVDGILYSVDLLAAGGVRALLDAGISVPGQVAVMGIDNSVYGEICIPRITSLDNKLVDSSIMAAHILTDCLAGRPGKVAKVILPAEIIPRETT